MTVYLDASVLVAFDAFFRANTPVLIVSDFAAAEFPPSPAASEPEILRPMRRAGAFLRSTCGRRWLRSARRRWRPTSEHRGRSYVDSTSASERPTRSTSRSYNGSVQRLSPSTKEWRRARRRRREQRRAERQQLRQRMDRDGTHEGCAVRAGKPGVCRPRQDAGGAQGGCLALGSARARRCRGVRSDNAARPAQLFLSRGVGHSIRRPT